MKTIAEIIELAEKKIQSADLLWQNDFYDDSYYIAGYAFELFLKAKICVTLKIEDFFDFDNIKNRKLPSSQKNKDVRENLYKPFKVHDYEQLIILGGIYDDFSKEINNNADINSAWSIVSQWNENCRYICGYKKQDVKIFIESIKKLCQWTRDQI